MKNFTFYFLFLASAALVMTSCSSSSNLSSSSVIQKRLYTKGYHVNIPGKYKENPQQLSVNKVEPIEAQAVVTASANSAEIGNNILASVDETPVVFEASKPLDFSNHQKASTPKVNLENHEKVDLSQIKKLNRNSNFQKDRSAVSVPVPMIPQGGNPLILYVILAILIPPLAVGLLYGITDKFWISLLLTLLFYIPGMIYSLIVVLQY